MIFRNAAACLAVLFLAGCAPDAIKSSRPRHVIVCPGIAGADLFCQRLTWMLDGDVPGQSAQLWDWTSVKPTGDLSTLSNIYDYTRNRYRADELARQIVEWQRDHPDGRLSLIGMSGGAGICFFTVQRLPKEVMLDRIVLVSGAVSPSFDLAPIIAKTRIGLFNYYSEKDIAVLRNGTIKVGTMDRKNVPAAGFCGFDPPADPAVADRIWQLKWIPAYRDLGNDGGHIGGLAVPFDRKLILPLFADPPDIPADWKKIPPRAAPPKATQAPDSNVHRDYHLADRAL